MPGNRPAVGGVVDAERDDGASGRGPGSPGLGTSARAVDVVVVMPRMLGPAPPPGRGSRSTVTTTGLPSWAAARAAAVARLPEPRRTADGAGVTEHRIDDLARAAGTTVRNVRVYQDRGLLPPPRKQGRTGWYSEAHLARLQLITRLLDRGYTFATIGELLTASERNLRVEDVLGLDDVLSRPWSDEAAGSYSLADLRRLFGAAATPALLERVCELGFVTRRGTRFEVASPRLLAAARDLVSAGFPLTEVVELAASVQQDLSRVAERFVSLVADHYLPEGTEPGSGRDISSTQLTDAAALIDRARPHASQAVHALFARAMEREVARSFDSVARRFTTADPGAEGPAAPTV